MKSAYLNDVLKPEFIRPRDVQTLSSLVRGIGHVSMENPMVDSGSWKRMRNVCWEGFPLLDFTLTSEAISLPR